MATQILTDNRQAFVELEYLMRKYYNENCAGMVSGECKHFSTMQQKEREANKFDDGRLNRGAIPMIQPNANGEWSRKTTEDLIKSINGKISGDKNLAVDLKFFEETFRASVIARIGEDEYKRLSRNYPSGDMAKDYVASRFNQMIIGQLSKSRIPKSSFEYILRQGFGNTLIGTIYGVTKSDIDSRLDDAALSMYKSTGMERVAATATTLGVDVATFGGTGFIGVAGKTGLKLGATYAADLGLAYMYGGDIHEGMTGKVDVSPVDCDKIVYNAQQQVLGEDLSRDKNKKVNVSQSERLHFMNEALVNKVKMQPLHLPYSPTQQTAYSDMLAQAHLDSTENCLYNSKSTLDDYGIKVKDGDVPSWMMQRSTKDNMSMSDYYISTAMEMKRVGKKDIKIGDKTLTLGEVAQRGYDYARAADLQRRQAVEQQQEQECAEREAVTRFSDDAEQELQDHGEEHHEKMEKADSQWGGLMEMLGLDGAGEMSHNLGYTLAMLPDMLYGMLTGKSQNLKLENNIFPLMAIFGGMFIENPLLKWLLIGLGATNLLNKGYGEMSGRDARQAQDKVYKKYPDVATSNRIRFREFVSDRMALVDIDGQAMHVKVSPEAVEAFNRGDLSEGALSNAILREYDSYSQSARQHYELEAKTREDQQEVVRRDMSVG